METLRQIADVWAAWAWASFWQFALLLGLVAVLDLVVRRWAWPQLRFALWLLVAIKLLIPPALYLPTSLTAGWFSRESALPFVVEGMIDTFRGALPVMGGGAGVGSAGAVGQWQTAVSALAMLAWIGGVVAIVVVYWRRDGGLRRALARDRAAQQVPAAVLAEVSALAAQVGLRRTPEVVITGRVAYPAVYGYWRQVVLLPPAALRELSARDLRNALLHELVHIRRGDLRYQALVAVVVALNWFNPFVYFLRNRLYDLRELSCDATVATLLRERTAEYRGMLVTAARRLLDGAAARPALQPVGLFESSSCLARRLRSLERRHWEWQWLRAALTSATVAGMLTLVLPMGQPEIVNRCKRVAGQPAPVVAGVVEAPAAN